MLQRGRSLDREDASEKLDFVPGQFRVLVVRRSKYATPAGDFSTVLARKGPPGGVHPKEGPPMALRLPKTCDIPR
jgi:transposase